MVHNVCDRAICYHLHDIVTDRYKNTQDLIPAHTQTKYI